MKLTSYYQSHTLFKTLLKHIGKSHIMASSILCRKGGQSYILRKDGTINAPLDWQAFSLMRACSQQIITSGPVVRSQPGLYMGRESYGDQHVIELYKSILGNRVQKLFVLTQSMTKSQLQKEINPQIYKLMIPSRVQSFSKLLKDLSAQNGTPILVEAGLNVLNQYFSEVSLGAPNKIDMLMISQFQGQLPHQYYGNQFQVPLSSLYKLTWISQEFQCLLPNGIKGTLTFQIHTLQ